MLCLVLAAAAGSAWCWGNGRSCCCWWCRYELQALRLHLGLLLQRSSSPSCGPRPSPSGGGRRTTRRRSRAAGSRQPEEAIWRWGRGGGWVKRSEGRLSLQLDDVVVKGGGRPLSCLCGLRGCRCAWKFSSCCGLLRRRRQSSSGWRQCSAGSEWRAWRRRGQQEGEAAGSRSCDRWRS